MKKCLGLALALLFMVAVFAACAAPQTNAPAEKPAEAQGNAEKPLKFAFICMNLENPWNVSVSKGFEDACKEIGVTGVTIDAQYKVDKQVNDLESVLNGDYAGIMVEPIDQNALTDLVEKAKGMGIVVTSVAQPQDNAQMIYTLDEYAYGVSIGTNAANWINEKLGGKGKVAIISQDNVEAVIARGNGVEDTIKKMCPDAEIVARQAGDTPEKGMKIIESVLQQHPDLNVTVATNDSGGIGGYRAMVAQGAVGEDRGAFSGDAAAECLAAMKEPNSIYRATVDLFPYKAGYDSAKKILEYVTNGVPSETEIIMLDMIPVTQEDLLSGKYVPKG